MAAEFLETHGINLQDEISSVQFPSSSLAQDAGNERSVVATSETSRLCISRRKINKILNVKLPCRNPDQTWDIAIKDGAIASIDLHEAQLPNNASSDPQILDGCNAFLCPSLCHPHIHLDKCFLLSDSKYANLSIQEGDFAEALSLTSEAKSRFTLDDLLRRGRWLIEESITAGVGCMRAFVEVDATVAFKCLEAAIMLKEQYQDACEIQICAFAQDPLFSGETAGENRRLLEQAVQTEGVDAVGSTPYVEADEAKMRENVYWAIEMALACDLHLDLHLDYNIDPAEKPMVYHVVEALNICEWTKKSKDKTILLGHCTRLTLFTEEDWYDLHNKIGVLPISFVGLPTSDLFMMGKPSEVEGGGERVRGTLQIPQMIEKYGMEGAVGINNVGNAFTPQGNCDPLSLASMCVGVYQAGTKRDAEMLYKCVSQKAKAAIGYGVPQSLEIFEGLDADLALIHMDASKGGRGRRTLQEVVYDPPKRRSILRAGHLVRLETD
ncbi:MAG: hypothetical protein Q9166_002654 [cf. Caloplaca sp. 2 TL-2023]